MTNREAGQRKNHEQIVEGEIIAELPDETLVMVPAVEGDKSDNLGIPKIASEAVDTGRRQLIIRLALGGAAALALGGSAALLMRGAGESRVVVLPNGAQANGDGTVDVAQLIQQVDDLQSQVTAIKAERDGLASQLQAANAELDQLRPLAKNAEALNKLWQQLDAIGLDDLLDTALKFAVSAFASVLAVAGLLQTGIADGQAALNKFVESLPGPKNGLQWLQGQIQTLSASLKDLGTQVQQVVAPVEPYAQMIANFVTWVLDRLPFGVGDKAKAGLNAMNAIIASLPGIVDGVDQDVLNPLIVWFGDDPVRNLFGLLLDPISNQLIDPARKVSAQIADFQDTFQNKLVTPAQAALNQRAELRTQIHQLQAQLGASQASRGEL